MAGRGRAPLAGSREHAPDELASVKLLLGRYSRYLLAERQLEALTVSGYVYRVRPFLEGRGTAEGLDLAGLTPTDVNKFLLAD
jgi:Phage integrase, N-terminal SAM-like domain